MEKTILVVDDEKDIVKMLKYNLENNGFNVLTAYSGNEALAVARQLPDLITLDILMPEPDGWEVARQLKRDKSTAGIPIMFVTAKNSEVDEIVGLELGAVDFIRKPLSMGAILARIRSVLRNRENISQHQDERPPLMKIEALEINVPNYSVKIAGKDIFSQKKEFELLAFLARHQGNVLSRKTLLHAIWGEGTKVFDRTVDVHIRKIREKLGACAHYITTVKRVGYRCINGRG